MMSASVSERLNLWGDHLARAAWPLFWQSSLLIVGMVLLDFFLRRKIRPSVRQALWLVVLIKLLLPPSLAFPTGAAWWLRAREVAPAKPPTASYVVTYGSFQEPRSSRREDASSSFLPVLPPVRLSTPARAMLASAAISAMLLIVMLVRWRHLRHRLRHSQSAPIWLEEIVQDARRRARCRRPVRLSLTDSTISPALCGLFRPVIVLPKALVKQLTPPQLRAVLLHELFHLRNGDVWINCFQSLLQIAFWWHPLLWLANARIRRIREEVVDDAVRLTLGDEADTYAPTLLEVARLALARPLATLGLVGILESRHALKQRVDRLLNFPAPGRVGLSIISGLAILAFASVALPMGQPPPRNVTPTRRPAPTLYYTFDQKFLDYFGTNGVDAVIQTLAQSNPGSKFLRYPNDSSVQPSESEPLNSQSGISKNDGAFLDKRSPVDTAKSAWGIQPLTNNSWVEYSVESGIATATNGAVVTHGGSTISADNITVNQQTGEIFASGSVRIQSGAGNPAAEIKSVSKSDWVKYDAATGTVTATNHAVLRQSDQVIEADKITFDRKAGIVSASGHAPTLQLAQVQPPSIYPSPTVHTSRGRSRILNKLEAIRLNHVAFDNLPLSEVVNYLRDEAKKRDPEGKGINFMINPNADLAGPPGTIDPATGLQIPPSQNEPADINGVGIRILPELNDVRIIDVLDAIIKVADKRIRYSIEDYAVSFRLAGNEGAPLFTRAIKVDPNVFAQGLESVVGFSVGNFQTGGQGGGGQQGNSSGVTVPRVQVAPNIGGQGAQGGAQGGAGGISGVTRPTAMISPQAVKQFFVNAGVDLTPPKSVFFNDHAGTLLVHATLNDFDIIEKAVMALNAGFVTAATSTARPATASVIETPSKLVLPQTNVAKAPVLGDLPVAESLSPKKASAEPSSQQIAIQEQRERLDAQIAKLNDLLAKYTEKHPSVLATRKQIEDLQKQLANPPPSITDSPTQASQGANSPFQVRTAQVSVANSPQLFVQADQEGRATIRQYRNEQLVEEKNVDLAPGTNRFVFQQITNGDAGSVDMLLTETMKVDPITFSEWVKKTAGLADNANARNIMDGFRKILLDRGLKLAPPANILYSERNGSLFARAIRSEMAAIEQIVQEVNRSSAQITIQAKFVEVLEQEAKGLNEYLAQLLTNAPNVSSIPLGTNTYSSLLGILGDSEFRVVLHALEQRDGADLVSEQSVTTLSGRQAQVQTVDVQTIVKLNPLALVSPGVASSNMFVTEPLYSGPVLDIIPNASGNDIELTVTATVREFVGYDEPQQGEAVPVYLDGQATTVKPPHPRTHVRTMQTAATIHDGQTLVLGRPQDEMVTYDKEGNILNTPSTTKKNLYVFITATLIDSKGNPIHNPAGTTTPPGHN